jgi:hypothetical protein
MPQLDKLSFSTQYFWLTIFFFLLYFICTNFFVVVVFKSLKVRNIIYKIWYFFVFKFNYSKYELKNKSINSNSFNSTYLIFYNNFFNFLNKTSLFVKLFTTSQKINCVNSTNVIDSLSIANLSNVLKQINSIEIDAI